jgi:type VI secretion system protein ImpH
VATEGRTPNLAVVPGSVEARLRRTPHSFEFFQAVRLLERLLPESSPVGRFVPPRSETVRFAARLSLAFPASEIHSLTPVEDGPPRMEVNFMGLTGPLGVLPIYYTDFLLQRTAAGDTASRDFFDLFHHRIISLFYRAWQERHFQILYGRGDSDRFTQRLFALVGLGHRQLQQRQVVADPCLAYYAGLITQYPRSAVNCEGFLADYFDVPVRIEQFVGAWYKLDEPAQTSLVDGETIAGSLGRGAVVGDEVFEPQARLRVVLGPLTLREYGEFLPDGAAYEPLRAMTRFFAGEEFDFELQLILKRDDTPSCELGAEGEAAPRLGWVSWAKSVPMDRNPAETILPL